MNIEDEKSTIEKLKSERDAAIEEIGVQASKCGYLMHDLDVARADAVRMAKQLSRLTFFERDIPHDEIVNLNIEANEMMKKHGDGK